ncbi:MAG TPA: hypothetical protein VD994_19870 [Prosthecobacter sp.]|nr:hypothetical protein [Prosthecobacter sp.]
MTRRTLNILGHAVVPLKSRQLHGHRPVTFDAPTDRVTNATSSQPYRAPQWGVRQGGNDHLQHQSKGTT